MEDLVQVLQSEHVLAEAAKVSRNDLDTLAAKLTQRSGIPHYVYATSTGDLVVFPKAYEEAMGLVRA